MTALRTFGKLLLRRLPRDDTLNRELAKDIILQVLMRVLLNAHLQLSQLNAALLLAFEAALSNSHMIHAIHTNVQNQFSTF